MRKVIQHVDSLTRDIHKRRKTLVVFDLDNTVYASTTLLGSDQWVTWKSEQIKRSKDQTLFTDLFKWYEISIHHGQQRLTSPLIVENFKRWQKSGVPLMALTSRNPAYREFTERELIRNKVSFKYTAPGAETSYKTFFHPHKREVSYMNGIFMTQGLHKGQLLKEFLRLNKLHYDQIIFVDDHAKNTNRVFESFVNTNTQILTIRFGGEDHHVQEFHRNSALKGVTTKQLKALRYYLIKAFGKAPRMI